MTQLRCGLLVYLPDNARVPERHPAQDHLKHVTARLYLSLCVWNLMWYCCDLLCCARARTAEFGRNAAFLAARAVDILVAFRPMLGKVDGSSEV